MNSLEASAAQLILCPGCHRTKRRGRPLCPVCWNDYTHQADPQPFDSWLAVQSPASCPEPTPGRRTLDVRLRKLAGACVARLDLASLLATADGQEERAGLLAQISDAIGHELNKNRRQNS